MKNLKNILKIVRTLTLMILMLFCLVICAVFGITALISCWDIAEAILGGQKLDYIIKCLWHTLVLVGMATISGVGVAVCGEAVPD